MAIVEEEMKRMFSSLAEAEVHDQRFVVCTTSTKLWLQFQASICIFALMFCKRYLAYSVCHLFPKQPLPECSINFSSNNTSYDVP